MEIQWINIVFMSILLLAMTLVLAARGKSFSPDTVILASLSLIALVANCIGSGETITGNKSLFTFGVLAGGAAWLRSAKFYRQPPRDDNRSTRTDE